MCAAYVEIYLKTNGLEIVEVRDANNSAGLLSFLSFCDNSRFSYNASTSILLVGRSHAVALGTRRFDGALYSTCTRENTVMMVARPWRISRR